MNHWLNNVHFSHYLRKVSGAPLKRCAANAFHELQIYRISLAGRSMISAVHL